MSALAGMIRQHSLMSMMVNSKTAVQIGEVWDAASTLSPPELSSGVVHLWRRRLDGSEPELRVCYELLSSEEKARADRFRVERPRKEFVLTRATLRLLLARYIGSTPEQIRFRYASRGKPALVGGNSLCFNVSHTRDLALLAFVRERAIGVDIESVQRDIEARRLAERFFSAHEQQALRHLSGEELQQSFFRCWTRKESYIKAKGDGLALPLDQFDVSITEGDRDALLATRPDPTEAARWTICDVAVGPAYAAAVAIADE